MMIRPRSRLPLGIILGLATLLASACSLHDSERALDTSQVDKPVVEGPTQADVQAAMERQALEAADQAAETDDLWERTRLGFGFEDDLHHERVEQYIEHYRANPRIIQLSTERAEPFAYFILSEIEQRDMPTELLLLPIVESGFAAEATSSGRAAGIWQFIPATGDHFDLTRDHWYDGRRDVYQSTLAALDYLEALYQRFDDWYLALAAYNFGQGNVTRAMERNAARGEPTDYWSLELSAEATAYVPRLLALRELFLKPDEHGTQITPIANEPALERIEPGRQADLALIAEMIGLEADDLKRLNPGYQRHATHPAHAQHLFIPHDAAETLEVALAEHGDDPLIRFREYTVASGDNLGSIAQRAGTRVAVLREMNGLNGDNIRAGQTLKLPVTGQEDAEIQVAAAAEAGELDTYEIQEGDSLWTISERTGMTISELRAANELERDAILRPGDTLQVAQANGGSASDNGRSVAYEVQPGDSLSSIARQFQVSVSDLRRWNSLNGDGIRAGETLTLYVAEADEEAIARARDA
ncbi:MULTISPECIES: LysM peptidoglycan-binding domain-containing protein [unclassified Thioalkalivibrio]|uniref:LysM peptidoglycan-binding domain-containing protein n=1 Tax=unclassified Thioalkalivibrio TaxID=2621013 RepID=UPI000367105B|nr:MULTISPECIES: LysM peptidoglycan-binding domain-containing protein [unclassified Thioalkalivibrio]